MTQVFISYSRKDLAFVERLAKDLQAAGLEVWYDLSGLDGGARWGQEIQNSIEASQIFVVVLSPNSVASEWVEKEFMYANSLKKRIIPLLYQPCKVPMWFINLHFIDVQGENYDSHFWVILKAMGVKPGDKAAKDLPAASASTLQALPETSTEPAPEKAKEKEKSFRMPRIHPAWIMGLVGLAVVLAFAFWGLPLLAARLAPTPTPTPTVTFTQTTLPTQTATQLPTFTPTFLPLPTLGIGSTWTRPADGMVMVFVPAGNFSMGSNSSSNEEPIHSVYLDAYWIDKTEVTNAMFAKCSQCGSSFSYSDTRVNYYGNPEYENYPVIWVNWSVASAYCQWAGARLPTEAEWEKAARGMDGRIYPWGTSSPNKSFLNYNQNIGDTTAVGSYPSGASPYGALDMAGNVWEWVNDWYGSNYYASSPSSNPQGPPDGIARVLRGGAFNSNEGLIRSTTRGSGLVNWSPTPNDGFRCVRSAP